MSRLLGFRIELRGLEHVPELGAAVFACNHLSYFDFVFVGLPPHVRCRRLVRFLAKESVFRSRVIGPLMRGMHHIPVDRNAGAAAYRNALAALAAGELVGIFPEQTIARSFVPRPLKTGAARLALEAGVPLIPVVTWGGHRVWTAGHRPVLRRRVPVTVVVDAPMVPLVGESPAALTARLARRMRVLVDDVLVDYPDRGGAGQWWWPAHLGGAAPAPESTVEVEQAVILSRRRQPVTGVAVERTAQPSVATYPATAVTSAVVIVLPGGKADSFAPTAPRQLARLRMLPFVRQLSRRGRRYGVEVWMLRYRYRGWNGAENSPVQDARWALDEVRRSHGDVPVVLVGHSMGGRTALRVAADPAVVGVVALAPWVEAGEPGEQLRDRAVLIAHGSADTVTSPRASRHFASQLELVARSVRYVRVRRDIHAMVFRPRTWHRLTVGYALDVLGVEALSPRLRRAMTRGYI